MLAPAGAFAWYFPFFLCLWKTNRFPFFSDFLEAVTKREAVSGGFSAIFIYLRFPSSARLHSTLCLPFLRRTRRPSSNIWFKTPAMVSYRTSTVSLIAWVVITWR